MTISTPQNRFLANRCNKGQFIGHELTKLENVGVVCSQGPAYADHMIINTALTAEKLLDKPIVLVGSDTDLLVMLIDKAIPLMDIYMQFSLHSPIHYFAFMRYRMLCMTSFLLTHLLDAIPFRYCTI